MVVTAETNLTHRKSSAAGRETGKNLRNTYETTAVVLHQRTPRSNNHRMKLANHVIAHV